MPTISYFYGIIIVMYLRNKEHNPPHVHAITQDYDAPFLIATGEIMEGSFPAKAKVMVKEFILQYQKEPEEMWETETYRKLPPLNEYVPQSITVEIQRGHSPGSTLSGRTYQKL
ncbi:MAG: DUF4160 domain-containing protein [Erysipelotrichaceae bacterium]|nr:DUF4160 domain-containing protein [Erysipelotrichaceae bacterium]